MGAQREPRQGTTRREFLRDAGLLGAAIAGATILPACGSPEVVQETPPATTPEPAPAPAPAAAAPDVMTADLASKKWSFEIPPDPIPESEIANTVTADVVVIGAGISGLVTALSAAEHGAKVVLVSASSRPVFRGGSFHAPKSRAYAQNGVEPYDVDFLREDLAKASFNVDQRKWYKFYNNAETAMNWLIDKMEAHGYTTVFERTNDHPGDPMHQPIAAHNWIKDWSETQAGMSAEAVANVLEEEAKKAGVEFHYKTVAKQLVRENNNTGRVTATIAMGPDGKYTKFVGTRGIVLATGDFSTDREMMAKYCPMVIPLLDNTGDQGYDNTLKLGGLMPGDGHKMALWVGAAWQRTYPCTPMLTAHWRGANRPYGSHRGLIVNKRGERFGNEDANDSYMSFAAMHQPDMTVYGIWSVRYAYDAAPWYLHGTFYHKPETPPEEMINIWDGYVETGEMVKGDTIDEVIQKLGLPAAETKATIERYNELCSKGYDEDFHKRAELLVPIDQPPFYGAPWKPWFLTVLGGLRTNINMQVCDENDNPIPGLFAVGTLVGDYYANMYTFQIAGNNLGANCLTFGYLTGKALAEGTV